MSERKNYVDGEEWERAVLDEVRRGWNEKGFIPPCFALLSPKRGVLTLPATMFGGSLPEAMPVIRSLAREGECIAGATISEAWLSIVENATMLPVGERAEVVLIQIEHIELGVRTWVAHIDAATRALGEWLREGGEGGRFEGEMVGILPAESYGAPKGAKPIEA